MPVLLDHIDKIAREKQRDVLYLAFHHAGEASGKSLFFDYESSERRKQVIHWLEKKPLVVHTLCWPFC